MNEVKGHKPDVKILKQILNSVNFFIKIQQFDNKSSIKKSQFPAYWFFI